MVFEKGHYVQNEAKEELMEQIEEIQTQVNWLYKKKNKTTILTDEEAGGNQKIVAWLLNRSKES